MAVAVRALVDAAVTTMLGVAGSSIVATADSAAVATGAASVATGAAVVGVAAAVVGAAASVVGAAAGASVTGGAGGVVASAVAAEASPAPSVGGDGRVVGDRAGVGRRRHDRVVTCRCRRREWDRCDERHGRGDPDRGGDQPAKMSLGG